MSEVEDLMANFDQRDKLLQDQYDSALAQRATPFSMTPAQSISEAVLGLLPLLIGGLSKGKEGLYSGAMGGLSGVQSYDKQLKDDFQRQQLLGDEAFKNIFAARKEASQDKSQLQKEIAMENLKQENREDLKRKFPPKGQNINNYMPGEPVPQYVDKDITKESKIAQEFQTFINYVNEEAPEMAKQTYVDENGTPTLEKTGEVLTDKAAALILGGEAKAGKVANRLSAAIDKYNQIITGASQADPEFKRRFGYLAGGGIVPQTVPVAIEMFKYLQGMSENNALTRFRTFQALSSKGDKEAAIKDLFGSIKNQSKAPVSTATPAPQLGADMMRKPGETIFEWQQRTGM